MKRKEDFVRSIQHNLSEEELARLREENKKALELADIQAQRLEKQRSEILAAQEKKIQNLKELQESFDRLSIYHGVEALSQMIHGGAVFHRISENESGEPTIIVGFPFNQREGRALEKTGKRVWVRTEHEIGRDFAPDYDYEVYEDEHKPSASRLLSDEFQLEVAMSGDYLDLQVYYQKYTLVKTPLLGSPIFELDRRRDDRDGIRLSEDPEVIQEKLGLIFTDLYKSLQEETSNK